MASTQVSVLVPQFSSYDLATYLKDCGIPCFIKNGTLVITKKQIPRVQKILDDTLGPNGAKFEPRNN